jgi:SAM-dependent methyltransferase
VRRFSADYLEETRRGLWADRSALAGLSLSDRECVLDAGCGAGSLTSVLREECPDAAVVGLDADPELLARAGQPAVVGDATALPVRDDAADLVVCQALLINLPDPGAAIGEFVRVSSDRVAAVEPDNAAVTVESTVAEEAALAARARAAYRAGVPTDVSLGAASDRFAAAGLVDVFVERFEHTRTVAPPYGDAAVEAARRKVDATRIDDARETLRAGGLDPAAIADLEREWRAMGRDAVAQMDAGEYRREETVPFYVTVGRVP